MRFKFRRPPRDPADSSFKPISKDMAGQLAAVLIKIVGESVRGKYIRAGLIGAISAGAFYATDPGPPVVSDPTPAPPAVAAPAQ